MDHAPCDYILLNNNNTHYIYLSGTTHEEAIKAAKDVLIADQWAHSATLVKIARVATLERYVSVEVEVEVADV